MARGDDEHAAALDEAAEHLYGVVPADFMATRAELVAQARADGDRALAAAIGKLRKPSTAAWLVNLLAYEAPDDLGALLDLGAAMRKAQSRLSGAELRKLTQQRHQVVRSLATRAHHLARDSGEQVSRSVLDQVGDTLLAALADPDVAEQVRAGHLVSPLSYSGFGPAGLAVVPDPVEPDDDEDDEGEDDEERAREERERQLEAARTALAQAESSLSSAQRKVARAERTVETSSAERERAQERRRQAQEALDRAVADAERLTAAADAAERTLEGQRAAEQAAQEDVDRARRHLQELEA